MRTLVFEPLIPTALWRRLAIGGSRAGFGTVATVACWLPRDRWLVMLALMAAGPGAAARDSAQSALDGTNSSAGRQADAHGIDRCDPEHGARR